MDVWEGYNMYKQQGFHLGLWPFLNPLVIKFVLKSVCYAPFLQWSAQLQIVLSIRLLCSLLTMVCVIVSNIVHQVAVLPSYNSMATVSSLCSLPVPILFQFILIYLNLFWIYLNFVEFLSEKQGHVTKLLGQFWVSRHHPTSVSHIHILDSFCNFRLDTQTFYSCSIFFFSFPLVVLLSSLFFEHVAHKVVVLLLRHYTMSL